MDTDRSNFIRGDWSHRYDILPSHSSVDYGGTSASDNDSFKNQKEMKMPSKKRIRRIRRRENIRAIKELKSRIRWQKKHGFNTLTIALQRGWLTSDSVDVAARFISCYEDNVELVPFSESHPKLPYLKF